MKNLTMPEGFFVKMKMEEEERQSKLEKIIEYVKNYPQEEINWTTFKRICELKGVDVYSLTQKELEYIHSRIK